MSSGQALAGRSVSVNSLLPDEPDLGVALKFIENVGDYPTFLGELSRIAPRTALFALHRARSAFDEGREGLGHHAVDQCGVSLLINQVAE